MPSITPITVSTRPYLRVKKTTRLVHGKAPLPTPTTVKRPYQGSKQQRFPPPLGLVQGKTPLPTVKRPYQGSKQQRFPQSLGLVHGKAPLPTVKRPHQGSKQQRFPPLPGIVHGKTPLPTPATVRSPYQGFEQRRFFPGRTDRRCESRAGVLGYGQCRRMCTGTCHTSGNCR